MLLPRPGTPIPTSPTPTHSEPEIDSGLERSADAPRARPSIRRPRRTRSGSRRAARWMFHGHLWVGVLGSAAMAVICATGILLNHKRALKLMPDVASDVPAAVTAALPLADLLARATDALPTEGPPPPVDRMDVRPDDGVVKVRFDDRVVTEVTLDLATGRVLHVGERNDVFLERLHSGAVFGPHGIWISDVAAVLLTLLLISGWWLWLYPRRRR